MMKTTEFKQIYDTPQVEVMEIETTGVICASTSTSPFDDGGTIPGDWQ